MLCSAFNGHGLVYNHQLYRSLSKEHLPPQTHDVYEILYVKTGDIAYSVEEKSYRVRGNSLILTRPGKLHILQFYDRAEYDRYDLFFEGESIHSNVFAQIPEELDVIEFGEDTAVLELFQKMERYCSYFEGDALQSVLSDLAEQMIYELVLFLRQGAAKHTDRHTVNSMVAAAIEYIDGHLDSNISLDSLCRELYISKSYLHQLFMRHLQITPRRYIAGKRLLAAQQAIRAGERPTDIYTQFGFTEYSSFYRAYHKLFGYAPSEEGSHRVVQQIEF